MVGFRRCCLAGACTWKVSLTIWLKLLVEISWSEATSPSPEQQATGTRQQRVNKQVDQVDQPVPQQRLRQASWPQISRSPLVYSFSS